jgi:hypothetical protein
MIAVNIAKLPVNIDQTANPNRMQDKGGPTGPKGDQGPPGPVGSAGSAGLRIVSGQKTVSCNDDEVLVSVFCSAGAPDGAECSAGITATGLCMRK